MSILDFAKKFARAGFYVFPLYSSSSGPQKPYGWALNTPKDAVNQKKIIPATMDESEIDSWPERIAEGYPGSKLVHYGVLGKGYVIIDIDTKDSKGGDLSYDELKNEFKIPNASLIVKSKSGGIHLYFKKSEKFKNVQIKSLSNVVISQTKYEGVDIRGDGGMVIGPTSYEWESGTYAIIKGEPGDELTVLPDTVTSQILKQASFNDIDNMTMPEDEAKDDIMMMLKRGDMPPHLPLGQRNEGFFLFVHALKNKGLSRATVRTMCMALKAVTAGPETFEESVNIEDILARAFHVDANNPYDLARDIIDHGFYQLMGYKGRLHYVILNTNPYTPSRNAHDESSMRTLFSKHAREMVMSNEKKKIINPIDIAVKILPDTNKVDTLGFRPAAGDVFTNSEDEHGKIFLNTYMSPFVPKVEFDIDTAIYDDFKFLISRIFGAEDTIEYQLGLDFIAWFLQYPDQKCVIAPYLLSTNRGVGKSLFFNLITKIFGVTKTGEKQAKMVKIEEITGRFFDPTGRLINLLDEVQFPVHRDMRKESTTFWRHLKNLITADTVPVELKGGDTYQMPNSAGFIMAGNTGGHFPMEEFDRRIWTIDNNSPILERGVVDRLFTIAKNQNSIEEQRRLIYSLRHSLQHHDIKLHLDSMRAPMNALKREMMLNSMTNEEEWFHSHFEDASNLLAYSPIISKSALFYLIDTHPYFTNSRWREDLEGLFRDFKRKGFLHPIRVKGDPGKTRQLTIMDVSPIGDAIESQRREILYTTREHGMFNEFENAEIIQLYTQNIHTIKQHKQTQSRIRAAAIEKTLNDPSSEVSM
jgi:hypothetical protein